MGAEHRRDGERRARLQCSSCEQDGQWTQRHPELNRVRAEQAIAGNPEMRAQYEADPDAFMQRFGVAPAPAGAMSQVQVRESSIHGQGLFAGQRLRPGETVAAMLNGRGDDVSPAAGKVNQSAAPNAAPVTEGGQMVLKALREVPPGEELVADYPHPDKR